MNRIPGSENISEHSTVHPNPPPNQRRSSNTIDQRLSQVQARNTPYTAIGTSNTTTLLRPNGACLQGNSISLISNPTDSSDFGSNALGLSVDRSLRSDSSSTHPTFFDQAHVQTAMNDQSIISVLTDRSSHTVEIVDTTARRPRFVHKTNIQRLQKANEITSYGRKFAFGSAIFCSYAVEFTLKVPGAFGASSAVMTRFLEIFLNKDDADRYGLYTGCAVGGLALLGYLLEKNAPDGDAEEKHREDFSFLRALDTAKKHSFLKQLSVAYKDKERMLAFLRSGKDWCAFDE